MDTNFDNGVIEKIDLINTVFDKLGIPRLMKNPDFKLGIWTHDFIAQFKFKKENCIDMVFDCYSDGIEIALYPEFECYYISNELILEKKEFCLGLIEDIFKCTIKRERYRSKYTKFYFYNEKGECVRTNKITGFFYLKRKRDCVIEEFPPIYLEYRKMNYFVKDWIIEKEEISEYGGINLAYFSAIKSKPNKRDFIMFTFFLLIYFLVCLIIVNTIKFLVN